MNSFWGVCPVYMTPEAYCLPAHLIPCALTRADWTRIGHLNQLESITSLTQDVGLRESSSV